IRLVQGDSDALLAGGGTGGSRSMMNSGGAIIEPLAQHLCKRRRVALAVVERAGDDRHGAVGFEAHAAHLLVGGRRHLEVTADADAAHAAALLRLALACGKSL